MARSRLKPMTKVAGTLREHLWGIINAVVLGATNAHLESVNAKIQAVQRHNMRPILCVGEGLDVRKEGRHVEHTLAQVRGALEGRTEESINDVNAPGIAQERTEWIAFLQRGSEWITAANRNKKRYDDRPAHCRSPREV